VRYRTGHRESAGRTGDGGIRWFHLVYLKKMMSSCVFFCLLSCLKSQRAARLRGTGLFSRVFTNAATGTGRLHGGRSHEASMAQVGTRGVFLRNTKWGG